VGPVIDVDNSTDAILRSHGLIPDHVHVAWRPHPGFQERALAAGEDDVLIGGAAGGGKTDVLLMKVLYQSWHPRCRALFLRATFPELRDVMDRAHRIFTPLGWEWNESYKRWTAPTGATLQFGYCSDYADAQRYWGQEFTLIVFDEIGKLADERAWDFVNSRLRVPTDIGFPSELLQSMCSANPGGAGHGWLRARYVVPTRGGTIVAVLPNGKTRAFYPGRLSDNPSLGADYRKQLENLPERLRRQLLDGDWDAGDGLALEELDERVHFVRPFAIPKYWVRWAAFDWGFRHPWAFVVLAESTDGERFVVDYLTNRGQLPHAIAAEISEYYDPASLHAIYAGHDAMQEKQSQGDGTPTIAETFLKHGITLLKANIARVHGLNALRQDLAWRGIEAGQDGRPRLRFFDTPRVRTLFEVARSMSTNPKNPEDALKRDANPDTGEGGDDGYDALRYAVASRIPRPESQPVDTPLSAFSPEALLVEYEQSRRLRDQRVQTVTQSPHTFPDQWMIS
jgi:hypothetical protein